MKCQRPLPLLPEAGWKRSLLLYLTQSMVVAFVAGITVAAGIDFVVRTVLVVVGFAEGVAHSQAQITAAGPFADILHVSVAIEYVVRLLGVENVLAHNGNAPGAEILSQTCLHIPVGFESALSGYAARIIASCGLESHLPRQTHRCHQAEVPYEAVLASS